MRLICRIIGMVVPSVVWAMSLDSSSSDSIRNVASTIAHGAMSYYNGNVSGQPEMVGDLPDPYYWWQAGALWGAMLDYYHFTGDSSYNDVVIQALTAPVNTGPQHDYNPPEHFDELGNDDLGFWGFAVMAAAERNFPQPDPSVPSWLTMALNIFNALSSRWDTTTCRGGVYWQVFASNPNGINYKNSVTNGGLFQLAARIARATGQQGYADWAAKVWDWCIEIAIDALLRCFCIPAKDRILVCPPTYGMYSVSAQVNDVGLVKVPLQPAPEFGLDTQGICDALSREKGVKLAYLCSPGNPTGSLLAKEDVQKILEHPTWNGVVVLDEAYIDFAPEGSSLAEWVTEWPNLVVMQTLSKAFGMAGIRLGAAFTSEPIARLLNSLKAPYNISSPTSALASYAASEKGLQVMRANRTKICAQRVRLLAELPKINGVGRLRGGEASNFLLFEILDTAGNPDNHWADRAHKLLEAAAYFFDNKILYEPACEPNDSCNNDMKFLKGYLARFMWQPTYHLPSLLPQVKILLEPSAVAAAQACSGGENSVTCGQKWNIGGFDGRAGLGQQMCALETIQGLLIGESRSPLGDGEIDPARHAGWNGRRTAPTVPTNQSVFGPEEDVDVHNEGGHQDETSGGRTTIGGLASPSWIGVCAATLAGSYYILVEGLLHAGACCFLYETTSFL
ncbi:hypothetical protein BN1723_009467 [Verticillium longisporum]|uniref:mannan endo-1,6-alpha-mannosidase n=1 Tax=Verticillium longisporum TaxID=100787 RepID=A0A0G4KQJ4_VERLO|nr:hypothetical protein BN1723_009467 [Verticillium longisporum]